MAEQRLEVQHAHAVARVAHAVQAVGSGQVAERGYGDGAHRGRVAQSIHFGDVRTLRQLHHGRAAELLGVAVPTGQRPRYNLAPSQQGLIAREQPEASQRKLVPLKWCLVPHWSKDAKGGYKLVNANSETAATKPSFRDCMKCRRCLVAADGWYEWKVTAAGKVPTFIQRVGHGGEIVPVCFAGL